MASIGIRQCREICRAQRHVDHIFPFCIRTGVIRPEQHAQGIEAAVPVGISGRQHLFGNRRAERERIVGIADDGLAAAPLGPNRVEPGAIAIRHRGKRGGADHVLGGYGAIGAPIPQQGGEAAIAVRASRSHIPIMAITVSAEDMDAIARKVLDGLPEPFRGHCADVVMMVEDFATPEQLASVGVFDRWELSGLYEGRPLPDRSI